MVSTGAICVLGMHRSGTSCITGLLEDAGVFLGGVSKQNPYNLKGNQENLQIMHLHEDVLKSNGSSWDNPPEGDVVWSEHQKTSRIRIIEQYPEDTSWAFKDPRTLFTLDGWLEDLPNMRFIGTFRHPSAVAQSLFRRGKMPPQQGYELWSSYNERLIKYKQTFGFDLVCFDLSPPAYLAAAETIFQRLDLDTIKNDLAFFEAKLRSDQIEPMFRHPPDKVMAIYEKLQGLST
ncbi:MAG TPA: sulfotransferase [Gammaproteobacteria bacterium]|nr:sulfotransferase [Gammaproteobacteria bacterium]